MLYKSWCIAVRRVWRLPWKTHCCLLPHLVGCINPELWFAKICIKFINMAFNSENRTVKIISKIGHSILGSTEPLRGHGWKKVRHYFVRTKYVISFPRNHFVRTKYVISFPRNHFVRTKCYFVPSKSFRSNEICYFVPSKSFRSNEMLFRSLEMISRERNML